MSDERNFKLLMSRVLAGGAMSAYPPAQEWEKSAISWALAQIDELSELRAKAGVRAGKDFDAAITAVTESSYYGPNAPHTWTMICVSDKPIRPGVQLFTAPPAQTRDYIENRLLDFVKTVAKYPLERKDELSVTDIRRGAQMALADCASYVRECDHKGVMLCPPAQAVSVPNEPLRAAPEGWVWRLIPISEDWPPC